MKRALAPFVILILLVAGAILAFNAGLFQREIEKRVAQAVGAKVQLGPVRLSYRWPLTLNVGSTHVEHPSVDLTWTYLEVALFQLSRPYGVEIKLHSPRVKWKTSPAPSEASAPTGKSEAGALSATPPSPHLILVVEDGEVESPWGNLRGLRLNFEQKRLLQSQARVWLSAVVRPAAFPVPLPLTLTSETLTLSKTTIKSAGLGVALAGMNASLHGTSLLNEDRHRWLLDLYVPDLAKVPQPTLQEVPLRNWRGSVRARAEVQRLNASQPWVADGEAKVAGLQADVQYSRDGVRVEGPLALDMALKFSARGEQAVLQEATLDSDFSGARVEYPGVFAKGQGLPLKLRLRAGGDTSKLNLASLELVLGEFRSSARGEVSLQSPYLADLKLAMAPVQLSHLQAWLVPLRTHPVKGSFGLQGEIQGPLADPLAARIRVQDLNLSGFEARVEFEKPGGFQIRGPVRAQMRGSGEWAQGRLKAASGAGRVDLSGAALVAGPLRKETDAKLVVDARARNEAASVRLEALSVQGFFGGLRASGTVRTEGDPSVNLALALQKWNLTEVRIASPAYRELIPPGELNADLKLQGRIASDKAWFDWPLAVSGSVRADLASYVLPVEETSESAPAAPSGTAPSKASSILPKGPLTEQARIAIDATIGEVKREVVLARDLAFKGQLASGRVNGSLRIGSIFDGQVDVTGLRAPLLEPDMNIQGTAVWREIDLRSAIEFTKPDFREFASGRSAGRAEFASRPLRARGEVSLDPVTFNTVQFGRMINELLEKAPMLKISPVKTDPLQGRLRAEFDLASSVLNLPRLMAEDVTGSELLLKGRVMLENFDGDLVGTFAWANPQVKGCWLEGNADDRGRLIVPLTIKGSLMSPGISFLSDTASRLASRALNCEKNKLLNRAKQEGRDRLKKELDKTLKGILGN